MGQAPRLDDYAVDSFFTVKLDGDPMAQDTWFREVSGLNIYIDQTEVQEGGKNDGPWKRPGPARFENLVLRRGISHSMKMFEWINNAVQGNVQRMSGKISLMQRNHIGAVMEWTFNNGWPCRYEGPKLASDTSDELAIETIEIAHEGLEVQNE